MEAWHLACFLLAAAAAAALLFPSDGGHGGNRLWQTIGDIGLPLLLPLLLVVVIIHGRHRGNRWRQMIAGIGTPLLRLLLHVLLLPFLLLLMVVVIIGHCFRTSRFLGNRAQGRRAGQAASRMSELRTPVQEQGNSMVFAQGPRDTTPEPDDRRAENRWRQMIGSMANPLHMLFTFICRCFPTNPFLGRRVQGSRAGQFASQMSELRTPVQEQGTTTWPFQMPRARAHAECPSSLVFAQGPNSPACAQRPGSATPQSGASTTRFWLLGSSPQVQSESAHSRAHAGALGPLAPPPQPCTTSKPLRGRGTNPKAKGAGEPAHAQVPRATVGAQGPHAVPLQPCTTSKPLGGLGTNPKAKGVGEPAHAQVPHATAGSQGPHAVPPPPCTVSKPLGGLGKNPKAKGAGDPAHAQVPCATARSQGLCAVPPQPCTTSKPLGGLGTTLKAKGARELAHAQLPRATAGAHEPRAVPPQPCTISKPLGGLGTTPKAKGAGEPAHAQVPGATRGPCWGLGTTPFPHGQGEPTHMPGAIAGAQGPSTATPKPGTTTVPFQGPARPGTSSKCYCQCPGTKCSHSRTSGYF